ncbi:MAG: transcriptional repressor [Candidatus Sericytochromatia bacterium]|nr:transcriptional repressor [Candidatus Sericytochromatia bacterium]
MGYTQEAIDILKKNGYKITKPRQIILKVLDESELPLSPYEISDHIKKMGETGDVVGVYRSLEILEESGIVHKVLSNGKYLKCNLKLHSEDQKDSHCHHNLICKKCGTLKEVDCVGLELFERILKSEYSFDVEHHALEFYGLCSSCK